MASTGTRLFKIATQINVGKETIVEFLQAKGFTIENKATATLTDDMVNLVLANFQKEFSAATKQRAKTLSSTAAMVREGSSDAMQELSEAEFSPKETEHAALETAYETVEQTMPPQTQPPTTNYGVSQAEGAEHSAQQVAAQAPQQPLSAEQPAITSAPTALDKTPNITEANVPVPTVGSVIQLDDFGRRSRFTKKRGDSADVAASEKQHSTELQHQDTPNAVQHETKPNEAKPTADPAEEHRTTAPPDSQKSRGEDRASSHQKNDTTQGHRGYRERDEKSFEHSGNRGDSNRTERPYGQRSGEYAQGSDSAKQGKKFDRPARDEQRPAQRPTQHPVVSAQGNVINEIQENDDEGLHDEGSKKKRKKRMGEIEVEGYTPSLPAMGLTILGKIDLGHKNRDAKSGEREVSKRKLSPEEAKRPKVKVKTAVLKGLTDEEARANAAKGKKKRKKTAKREVNADDVERAIRRTLSGQDDSAVAMRSRLRQKRRAERAEEQERQAELRELESSILRVTEFITVAELANVMGAPTNEVIMKCMGLGLMVSINQRLERDTITLIADDYGFTVEFEDAFADEDVEDDEDDEATLQARAPIVTVMGHVDHGKTSLLDYIRKTSVVTGEAGGITQHIGAYSVKMQDGKFITFLDTPGHQAFTAMRARGAQVTDIVVLVVAADDNVMPQTIEAISHARAANVPMVVAINKIDKPEANPDRVRQQLADHNVLVEEWGGKFQSVEISAKKGLNIDQLLEKILLEAELLNLRANPNRHARGTVVEAKIDKGKGPVATVIVQKGTLRVGDPFVCGTVYGRVRAMLNEQGERLEYAIPSTPVQLLGLDGVPQAGDTFTVMESESEAKNIANYRQQIKREQDFKQVRHVTLDDLADRIKSGGMRELNIILKGDTDGSVEALADSLQKLSTTEVGVSIIYRAVGPISESDVMLAAASDAVIIGFHVRPTPQSAKLAENESVDIRLYRIIYDCINEVKLALEGMLTPEIKEEVSGAAEIREVFRISKVGNIAGCYMIEGKINRNDTVRVVRDGFEVYTGKISSLKRLKDDVREVDTGFEFGISIEGYNDIKVGDIIEAVRKTEVKRKL